MFAIIYFSLFILCFPTLFRIINNTRLLGIIILRGKQPYNDFIIKHSSPMDLKCNYGLFLRVVYVDPTMDLDKLWCILFAN